MPINNGTGSWVELSEWAEEDRLGQTESLVGGSTGPTTIDIHTNK